jgi:hypothetical protein
MRKSETADIAARNEAAAGREQACIQLVCLALTLALVMLACRIFSIW